MKTSIIAMLLLTSAAAFANEAADDAMNRAAFAGDRSRAEVNAEVVRAREAGTLNHSDYALNVQQPAVGAGTSRAAVRAEAVQAARAHVIHELI